MTEGRNRWGIYMDEKGEPVKMNAAGRALAGTLT